MNEGCVLFEEITSVIISKGSHHGGSAEENGAPYCSLKEISGF